MKATIIIIVLLSILTIGYILINNVKIKEKPNLGNQNSIQDKSPQDLSIEILSLLDEPRHWRDDQVHAVNWTRVLQLIKAGADINQKDKDNHSILERVQITPTPNERGIDLKQERIQRAEVEEELRKRGAVGVELGVSNYTKE